MNALTGLFHQVLEISLALSALIALLLLARPLLQRRYRAKWAYWAWLVLALRLAVPFNLTLPRPPVQVPVSDLAVVYRPDSGLAVDRVIDAAQAPDPLKSGALSSVAPAPELPRLSVFRLHHAAALLWAAGGLGFLGWQLLAYARFCRKIRRWRGPEPDPAVLARFDALRAEAGVRRLALGRCPAISSPMVTGFLRPALLLPAADFSPQALDAVFRHELVHAKRHDIWYKLLLLLARCVHWFNPLVHLMARRAGRDLEVSCDEAVVSGRDEAFRRDYGRAVLDAVACARDEHAPLTTYFKGGRRAMLERLKAILSTLPKRRGIALLAAVVLVAATLAAVVSFGGKAPEPGRTMETDSFSLSLPVGVGYVAVELADGGSAAEFSRNMAPAGGVWLATCEDAFAVDHIFYDVAPGISQRDDSTRRAVPDFSLLLAGGNFGTYDEPLPQASVLSSTAVEEGGWAGSAWEQLVERDGHRELHFIYRVSPLQFYDLWFRLDAVSQAEARSSAATFLFGGHRTPSPDGTRVLSVYAQGGEGRCFLWSIQDGAPVLTRWSAAQTAFGEVAALGVPLWSPDGTRAVLTVSGSARQPAGFFFPVGAENPEDLRDTLVSGLPFSPSENGYGQFVPRQWRADGSALQLACQISDSGGTVRSGTVWYELDGDGRCSGVTGYEDTPLDYAGPVLASAQAGGRTFTLREYWTGSLCLALDEFGPEAIPELLSPFEPDTYPGAFLSLGYGAAHPYAASVTLAPFEQVLGEDGVILSYPTPSDGRRLTEYYYLRSDGTPTLLAAGYGGLRQVDADGDGDAELLGESQGGGAATLFDRRRGMTRTAPIDAAAVAALEAGPLPGGLAGLEWGTFSPSSLGSRHPQVRMPAPMFGAVINQFYTLSLPQWLTLDTEPGGPHGEAQIWLGDPSDGNLAGGILWQEGKTDPFDAEAANSFVLSSGLGFAPHGGSISSQRPDEVRVDGMAVATRPYEESLHLIYRMGESQVYHLWLRLDYVPQATVTAVFDEFHPSSLNGGD